MFGAESEKSQQELDRRRVELHDIIVISIDDYRESVRLHDEIVEESGANDHRLIHEADYPIRHRLGPDELSHIAVCFELEDIESKQRDGKRNEYPRASFLEDVSVVQQQRNQQLYLHIKVTGHHQVDDWQKVLG